MTDFLTFSLPHIFASLLQLILLFFIIRLIRARLHWSPVLILIGIGLVLVFSTISLWLQYTHIKRNDFITADQSGWIIMTNIFKTLGFILQIIGYCSFFHFIYKHSEMLRNIIGPINTPQYEALKNENDIID